MLYYVLQLCKVVRLYITAVRNTTQNGCDNLSSRPTIIIRQMLPTLRRTKYKQLHKYTQTNTGAIWNAVQRYMHDQFLQHVRIASADITENECIIKRHLYDPCQKAVISAVRRENSQTITHWEKELQHMECSYGLYKAFVGRPTC